MIFPQEELTLAFKVGFATIPALGIGTSALAWRFRGAIYRVMSGKDNTIKDIQDVPSQESRDNSNSRGVLESSTHRSDDPIITFFDFFTSSKLSPKVRDIMSNSLGTRYNTLHDYYNRLSMNERIRFEGDILGHVDEIVSVDQMIVHFLFGLSYAQARDYHLSEDTQLDIGEDTTGHIVDNRESFDEIGVASLSLDEVDELYARGKLSEEERDFLSLAGKNSPKKKLIPINNK